jgi:hypothetical protein
MRFIRFLLLCLLGLSFLPVTRLTAQTTTLASDHPRLWLRPADVTRLQGWTTANNPIFAEGLLPLIERAKAEMDSGVVINEDCGQRAYSEYLTEGYGQLFAFMSLVDPDPTARADYAQRARTLLMHVMNLAALGPAQSQDHFCPGDTETRYYPPFRHPDFFTEDSDRLRWQGEAFPLIVDWIYPSLSAEDKATIAKVFTRWGDEIINRGYHHPEPVGLLRDAQLTNNRSLVRWSGNNYYAAHMRNLGMLSLALDPADSTPQLQGYLDNAVGSWLYIFDANTRSEARGGLLPEGFEYSPQTASYAIQFLWALRTAGYATDPNHPDWAIVNVENNPFWSDLVTGYLHSLSPATKPDRDTGLPTYLPAWYGDAQRYHLADFIDAFGALGAYDQLAGNSERLNAVRWIQTHTPIGGPAYLTERVRLADYFRSAMLYFMLFDPAAAPATDPRLNLSTDFVADGVGRLFSRTGWDSEAAWLVYSLGWNEIDHQMADGNHLEFYYGGEWLTKARNGYANIAEGIASSEFRNTLALKNQKPDRDESDWRIDLWLRGSQWNLVSSGNPGPLLRSFNSAFSYMGGDATNLYNSENEQSTQVGHASRDLVWLKPDLLVVYDRADAPAANFKRVWWQLPNTASISGNSADMATDNDHTLFITALLPEGATMRMADKSQDNVGETVATDEVMTERLVVEAPPTDSARFLHMLQAANTGVDGQPATVVRSVAGSAYEGLSVTDNVVLFPVVLGQPFAGLSYSAPAASTLHIITGLEGGAGYTVTITANGDAITVQISAGGPTLADSAGVLVIQR